MLSAPSLAVVREPLLCPYVTPHKANRLILAVSIPAETPDANEKAWNIEADLARAVVSCITSGCNLTEDVSATGRKGRHESGEKPSL
jgi:hypothetical protein